MLPLHLIHAGFFAAAGLTVAVPIVIHLLFRQRVRTVPIGSLKFLMQVIREHQRRRRLRQWILLALRALALLLLAMLFARPYLDASHWRGLQQEIVVLVDRSASMAMGAADSNSGVAVLVGGGDSSWKRAITQARRELAAIDENAVVHLGLCDASGVEEVKIDQLSDSVATSNCSTDHGLALAWARDLLASSNRADRRIVLITDLQRSGLSDGAVERLPPDVQVVVRDVGQTLQSNVSIESAGAAMSEIRPDEPVSVRAVVRNHGPLAVRDLLFECELTSAEGATIKGERGFQVLANGTTIVQIPLSVRADGVYRGKVSFKHADSLAADNERWLAIEARRPDRVLLVDGQEGRSVFANETYYLETALRVRSAESGGRLRSFEVERIVWESGRGFPRLDGYRAVVMANVRRMSDVDSDQLQTFVSRGGSLLVFAGDQVSTASLKPLVDAGLLPGRPADAPVARRARVTRWNAEHAALAPFSDAQRGDLRRLEVTRHLPLVDVVEPSITLMSIGDSVLAAERPVERGRVIYFGLSADRDWSDWPRSRLYVPLVRQWLAYLTDQLAERSAVVEQPIATRDEKPGIEAADERWIVRNLDPRESAPDRLTEDDFRKAFGLADVVGQERTSAASAGIEIPADSLRPDEIWPTVIGLLMVVLAGELLLASRVHA